MSAKEWIASFAAGLGVEPPDDATIEALLGVAGVAAHASERIAAPITCYLIGLAGADVAHAATVAGTIAETEE
jgi:hypothetical protein